LGGDFSVFLPGSLSPRPEMDRVPEIAALEGQSVDEGFQPRIVQIVCARGSGL
jgi:hypothetical protein